MVTDGFALEPAQTRPTRVRDALRPSRAPVCFWVASFAKPQMKTKWRKTKYGRVFICLSKCAPAVMLRRSSRVTASRFFSDATATAVSVTPLTGRKYPCKQGSKRECEGPAITTSQKEKKNRTPNSACAVHAEASSPPTTPRKRHRSTTTVPVSPSRSPIKAALSPNSPPSDFEAIWEVVKALRNPRDAPVDEYGAEALGTLCGKTLAGSYSEAEFEFGVLVALVCYIESLN